MKQALLGLLLAALATPGVAAGSQEPRTTDTAEAYFQFARARTLELRGDWEAALEAYDQALSLDPLDSSIYSEIALAYASRNDIGSAIDYAERSILIDPDNLDAHRLLSRIYTTLLASSDNVSRDMVDQAIEELEHVVRLDPTERDAYLTLGRLYRALEDPERAAEVYRDFLRVEPASEEGAVSLAELQVEAGNLAEAINILNDFLASQPDSQPALALLGDVYLATSDFDKAVSTLETAVTLAPDDLDLLTKLAESLFLADRLDEAATRFEEVVSQDPDNPVTHLRLGQIYRQQMEYEKARENIEMADRAAPGSPDIGFELALLDRDEGRFEEALEKFTQLLQDSEKTRYTPQEVQLRQQLLTHVAIVQSFMGRYMDAVETFTSMKELLRGRDDGTVDTYIVDTLRMGDESQEALDWAVEARRTFPENRQLKIDEADLVAELVDRDQGAGLLREMLTGTEDDGDVYSTLVGVYERDDDYVDAQAVLDEMLDNLRDDETALFLQGALYERQENIDGAEAAFRRALEINANNPATLNYLGYMLADRNRNLEEALGMLKTAVAADPINGAYLDSLGWAYYRLDQLDLAERYLTRAVLFSDSDPTLHEHLGDLYRKTGRIELAREAYQRSLERAEKDDERMRVREKLNELSSGAV